MQIMPIRTWAEFRDTCITRKNLDIQYYETEKSYEIFGAEAGAFIWSLSMTKTSPPNADQVEFDSMRENFNGKTSQIDSDGAQMSRTKVAPSGWNFNLRGVEFTTSVPGSVVNKDAYNVDMSDATLTLYNENGDVVTNPVTASSLRSTSTSWAERCA